MCERHQRGILIAAVSKIVQKGQVWIVPSQSSDKKYTVCPDEQTPYCSCPDHETRGVDCKHIHAVRIVIEREQHMDGSETITETVETVTQTVRKTYPQQWAEYNAAQVVEKDMFQSLLRDLCDQVKEPSGPVGRGRPRIPMSDQIFIATFKVYSMVSGRRFMCDLDDAKERGYLERTPHFNSIFNALESEELTPLLTDLIINAAMPLKAIESDFAVDSSGFSASKYFRWFDFKYGKDREYKEWVKVHIACGVKTQIVTAVEIHDRHTNDCPLLPSLVKKTAENFDIAEISADKQYASEVNFTAVNAIGADPYIPFRSNTTGERSGEMYRKAFMFFSLYREDFLQSYHKRSNVESCFSMMKRKFGDFVRSKTPVAMKNEVLAKILCHNICCLISAVYELGIKPEFDRIVGCTKNTTLAQEIAVAGD